jgi:hypothetical protein
MVATACWTGLSSKAGTPNGRCRPSVRVRLTGVLLDQRPFLLILRGRFSVFVRLITSALLFKREQSRPLPISRLPATNLVMAGSQHLKSHQNTDWSDPLWIFGGHRCAHVCSIFGGLCKVCITTQYCSVFACNALSCSSVACGARTSKMILMP